MNLQSYINRFTVLMSFVEDKKKSKVYAERKCYNILGGRKHVIWS